MTFNNNKNSEAHYHRLWKSIVNVMTKSNLKISRIAQAGSRALRTHRPDSDMDVIFSVTGNPSEESFYPRLISVLKSNFKADNVYPGSNYNVVHLDFQSGAKFDLVLLSENDFDDQHEDDVNYRRENL